MTLPLCGEAPPRAVPVGYMVLRREVDGTILEDWDGVVHSNQASANSSCIEGKQAGWDVFTVACYPRKIVEPQS